MILLAETWVKKPTVALKRLTLKKFPLTMDDYVRLPKTLFQEFVVLWRQVESMAPTLSDDAQELIGKVRDTIGKIKIQVSSSECEIPGMFK